MVLYFHFTFKPFSGHAQKRERARERERERQHGREIAPAPSTGEGEIDPHPRAPTNPENPRLSSFVKQCPNHQIVNPFLRSSSSSVEPIPQIVELVRRTHSSDHEPKSFPPRSSRRITDLLALGRSRRRSACSLIFGLISDWMNFFLLGIENLGFDEFGFCWS